MRVVGKGRYERLMQRLLPITPGVDLEVEVGDRCITCGTDVADDVAGVDSAAFDDPIGEPAEVGVEEVGAVGRCQPQGISGE